MLGQRSPDLLLYFLILSNKKTGLFGGEKTCVDNLDPGINTRDRQVLEFTYCALKITNDQLLAADRGKWLTLVLLDWIIAFDTVDHTNVFEQRAQLLAHNKVYVSNKTSSPTLGEFFETQVRYGVPQGFVLGSWQSLKFQSQKDVPCFYLFSAWLMQSTLLRYQTRFCPFISSWHKILLLDLLPGQRGMTVSTPSCPSMLTPS